jgi:preprotein translocase subunit YajC
MGAVERVAVVVLLLAPVAIVAVPLVLAWRRDRRAKAEQLRRS